MASQLCEMENNGLIVIGREVGKEFESVEEIEAAAAKANEWAQKTGLPLGFVYCGTTINWPDEFEYTPCLVGAVTYVHWGGDDEPPSPIPSSAFTKPAIPDEFWAAMNELGLQLSGETKSYVAVAGWTWTSIKDASGEHITGVAAEDNGFRAIDDLDLGSKEGLQMEASYC